MTDLPVLTVTAIDCDLVNVTPMGSRHTHEIPTSFYVTLSADSGGQLRLRWDDAETRPKHGDRFLLERLHG